MAKMMDVGVATQNLLLPMDGTGPESMLKLDELKFKRFMQPTSNDVFRSLRHILEKSSTNEAMVLNTEGGRLIAFRINGDGRSGEWERVPPIDGWRHRNLDYNYFFILEPEIGLGEEIYQKYENRLKYDHRHEQLGDYFAVVVKSDYRKHNKDDFEVVRCGFVKKDENEAVGNLFRNSDTKLSGGNSSSSNVGLKTENGNIEPYFHWPHYSDIPELKEVWSLRNRVAMMAIGGDFLPSWYKEKKEKWVNFVINGDTFIYRLAEERGFHLPDFVTDNFTENLKKVAMPEEMVLWGPISDFNKNPAITSEVREDGGYNAINLMSVLSDTSATIFRGIRNNDGRYSIGNWGFEVIIHKKAGEDNLYEVQGLRITNKEAPGIELILKNTTPELIVADGRDLVIQEIEGMAVNKAVLRSC